MWWVDAKRRITRFGRMISGPGDVSKATTSTLVFVASLVHPTQ